MRFKICALITVFFILSSSVQAAMTSTNFEIRFDSLNSGGVDNSTSTNYSMYDTLGEQGTGYSSSTNYTIHAGYRQSDEYIPTLSFSLGAQENDVNTAFTAFSDLGKTVTVAITTGFSTGTYIGVVENVGLNQFMATGKITDITGLVITVDKWDGSSNLMSPGPLGGDDFVYRMESHAASFGNLSTNSAKTSSARTEVSTNATNGYSLKIQSDDYLMISPTAHIIDVQDGSVTLGSEEYGARVFGSTATSTGLDFAVTSTLREIQKSVTTATDDRIVMVYKITITPATPAGRYTQTVRYLLTANF